MNESEEANCVVYIRSGFFQTTLAGLKPAYNAQTPLPSPNKGFAGILNYSYAIDITPQNNLSPNQFINLSNGIIDIGGTVKVQNCQFKNIQPDPAYNDVRTSVGNNNFFNGSAIFAKGTNTNATLTQTGNGKNGTPSFVNCKYGIYAITMNVSSTINNMQQMTTGYRVVNGTGRAMDILHNTVQSTSTAIELLLNDGSIRTIVEDNHITFGTTAVAPQCVGILAAELNGINPKSHIHNNEIFFAAGATNAYAGIHANATSNYQITENTIVLDDNNKNQYGIFASGCVDHIISCNNILGKGTYPTKDQAAICTIMGSNPTIGCNNMDHTENGILVLSDYNLYADIHTNVFNDHVFGLHYGTAAITPAQDYKGNLWKKTGNQNGGLHAWNENYLGPFIYRDPTIIANFGFEPLLQFPTQWFYQPPQPTQFDAKCSIPTFYCTQFHTSPKPIITPADDAIIDSAIVNGAFTDETQWRQESELLDRIYRYPSLLNIPRYYSFYGLRQNSFLDLL